MISSDNDLRQSQETLTDLELALAALKRRLLPANESLFAAMARDYLDSIENIRAEIDEYIGASEGAPNRAELWLGLVGGGLSVANAPSSILVDRLGSLRKAVQRVAEFFEEGKARKSGRPPSRVAELCDFRVAALTTGSLRIGLRLPEPQQLTLRFNEYSEDQRHVAERSLQAILETIAETVEWRLQKARSPAAPLTPERRLLLAQALKLIPSKRSRISAVFFEGPLSPRPTPIRAESWVRQDLQAMLAETEPERIETHEGTSREIDLDRRRFILRERPDNMPDIFCTYPEELGDEAKQALDRRVEVEGFVNPEKPTELAVQSIEVIDD